MCNRRCFQKVNIVLMTQRLSQVMTLLSNTSLSWNWCRTTNEGQLCATSGLLLQNAVYRVRSPIAIGEPDELTESC